MKIIYRGEEYSVTEEFSAKNGRKKTTIKGGGADFTVTNLQWMTAIGDFGLLPLSDIKAIVEKAGRK